MKQITIFLVFVLVSLSCATQESGVRRSEYLDPEGNRFLAEWEVSSESKTITFNLTVQGTGYVGFGISPSPNMKGADIVIGGVKDGESYFNDYHAEDNGYPVADASQNWELLEASEVEGVTNLRFWRYLDTCDEQDVAITEDTQYLIWAIGETDDISKHGNNNRGPKIVNILDPSSPVVDTSKFNSFRVKHEMTMPPEDTTYWCTIHKAPEFGGVKHHIVGFAPVLPTPLSVKHTHHLTLSICVPPEGSTSDQAFGQYLNHPGAECYGMSSEFPVEECRSVFYIWAVGGEPLFLPDLAGYPVGTNNDSLYVMIEIHYDNPDKVDDATFETSVDVFYTNETRQHDASLMLVMHDVSPMQTIPPKIDGFVSMGHCGAETTREQIPAEGVHVFNGMLHAHTAGKAMKVRHFRDGKELPWLIVDKHYDFNYQTSRPYKEYVDVYPGDAMTIECTYDTTSRNMSTIGGFPSRFEMCQAFFWLYPSSDLISCSSSTDPAFLEDLGIQDWEWSGEPHEELIVLQPDEFKGWNYSYYLSQLTWTPKMINNLQIGQQYHTSDKGPVTYPAFDEAWMPPKTCQDTTTGSSEEPTTPGITSDVSSTPSDESTTPNAGSINLISKAAITALIVPIAWMLL